MQRPSPPSLPALPTGPDQDSDEEETVLLSPDSLRNKAVLIGSNLQNHHGKNFQHPNPFHQERIQRQIHQ